MPAKNPGSRPRADRSSAGASAYEPGPIAVSHSRLAAHLLDARTGRGALRTVRRLVGVQAQMPSAAALALRARTAKLRAATTAPRLAGSADLVRTWLMRGTIHVVAAEDAGWLRDLLAPVVLRGNRRRYDQLGLDEATLSRAVDVLARLVEAGPRTRSELFDGLTDAGIDPAGQRGIHLVQHAAWHGALVFAPDREGETAWGASSPACETLDREYALCELARRYAAGYGASNARDLAAWSGLPVADARLGWRLAELPDSPAAATTQVVEDAADEAVIRLLPHFDPYLLGYRPVITWCRRSTPTRSGRAAASCCRL